MISAVSSFSALTPNTKIIASASDAAPVQQIQRIGRRSPNSESAVAGSNSFTNSQPVDKFELLGENSIQTGKSYGMEANELRNKGLQNKLSPTSEGVSPEEELDIMGKAGVDETSETEESGEEGAKEVKGNSSEKELTEEQQAEVAKLKSRDTEVRTHEQAHLSVAGSLAQGGASFEYQEGPDGKRYAVGGEVSIDTSPASTPEATIKKMQQVKAAALAPASPSSQDRSVAASATQQIVKAQQEAMTEEIPEDEEQETQASKEVEDTNEINSTDDNTKPQTVEAMQEKSVEEATSGESNNKIEESGMAEVPIPQGQENGKATNSNNVAPISRLSIQQYAARVAYGIPA